MQREGNHYHLLLTKRINDHSYLSGFYNCFKWLCFGVTHPLNKTNDIADKQKCVAFSEISLSLLWPKLGTTENL